MDTEQPVPLAERAIEVLWLVAMWYACLGALALVHVTFAPGFLLGRELRVLVAAGISAVVCSYCVRNRRGRGRYIRRAVLCALLVVAVMTFVDSLTWWCRR